MIPKHIERKFTQNLFTIERDVYRDGVLVQGAYRDGVLVTMYSSGGKIPCFTGECKKTWNSLRATKNHLRRAHNNLYYRDGEINIVQYTLTQKTKQGGYTVTRTVVSTVADMIKKMQQE